MKASEVRKLREEGQALIARATALHEDAHRLGFHRTGHAMHEVVRAVGWELADKLEDATAADRRSPR